MGQQYSIQSEGTSVTSVTQATTEGKTKPENGGQRPNLSWKDANGASSSSSQPGPSASETAENSNTRTRLDGDAGRMSIRAVIDTFIENCLSASSDLSPDSSEKTVDEYGSFTTDNYVKEEINKGNEDIYNSSKCDNLDPPKDTTSNLSGVLISENISQIQNNNVFDKDNDSKEIKLITDYHQDNDGSNDEIKEVIKKEDGEDGKKPNTADFLDDGPVSKQRKASFGPEKRTFSAYLQERLIKMNFIKTELAQLESQGQMLMWEVDDKSLAVSETGSASTGQGGSSFISGPVRLQTLIDKVLDISLKNQDLLAGANSREENRESALEKQAKTKTPSPEAASKEPQGNAEKSPSPVKERTHMCFKDHIEKVLLESFLSFEEEERQEELRAGRCRPVDEAGNFNGRGGGEAGPGVQPSKQNVIIKDGSMSVQDIVDQVINQTEMISKLITPSSSDRVGVLPSTHPKSPVPRCAPSGQSFQGNKFKVTSQNNRSLIEAQRDLVQKEHQSISNLGRKRGRPKLNSHVNSSPKVLPEMGRDFKSGGRRDGIQVFKSSHVPFQMNDHPQSDHIRLDRTSQPSNQIDVPGALTSKGMAPPSALMFQQRIHMNHKSSPLSPPAKLGPCITVSSSSGYRYVPIENLNHSQADHHMPIHPRSLNHWFQPLDDNQTPATSVPPPLLLANPINENMNSSGGARVIPAYHIPAKSCSCQSCIAHFSPHSTRLHHLITHPQKFDRVAEIGSHPLLYDSHSAAASSSATKSTSLYPQKISVSKEGSSPVMLTINQGHPAQGSAPVYLSAHSRGHMQLQAAATQETLSSQHFQSKGHSPSQHHPYQSHMPQVGTEGHIPKVRTEGHIAQIRSDGHVLRIEGHIPQVRSDGHIQRTEGHIPQGRPEGHIPHVRSEGHIPQLRSEGHIPQVRPEGHIPQGRAEGHILPGRTSLIPQERTDRLFSSNPRYSTDRRQFDIKRERQLDLMSCEMTPFKQINLTKDSSFGDKGDVSVHQDSGQPLDLSVKQKSSLLHGRGAGTGPSTCDALLMDRTSLYRAPSSDSSSSWSQDQGQRVSSDHHHLQRLESSVDRFFPQGSAHPMGQQQQILHQKSRVPQNPAQQSSVSRVGLPEHSHPDIQVLEPLANGYEPTEQRHSLHIRHSPGDYAQSGFHQVPLTPPRPQRNNPSLLPQPHHQKAASGSSQPHSRSPDIELRHNLIENVDFPQPSHRTQTRPMPAYNPHQRPSSHGSVDSDSGPVYAPSPTRPHNSPSPEDAHKQNVCKHEPIQNIIGSHPPSDILYLICRLCRQTYGSPYGFRKHFRNQHGFEPKAGHTIIQTISATKTAMGHTGPVDQAERPLLLQSGQEGHNLQFDQSLKSQTVDQVLIPQSGQPLFSPTLLDDGKLSVTAKDLPVNTKYLECPECGQTFQLNDFGSYKRHCRQHHLNRSSGPYACHECQKTFSEPGQLQDHLDSHSSFTPSVCGICHAFFSSPSYLSSHLQSAHGAVSGGEEAGRQHGHAEGESSKVQKPEHVPEINSGARESKASSVPVQFSPKRLGNSSSQATSYPSTASSLPASPNTSNHQVSLSASAHHPPASLPQSGSSVTTAGSALSSVQHVMTTSSSSLITSSSASSFAANHMTSLSSNHRHISPPSASEDPHFLTVHTPKGLEVQKLPADPVVTTASPDSSYDEAKCHTNPEPESSTRSRAASSQSSISDIATAASQKDFRNLHEDKTEKETLQNPRPGDSCLIDSPEVDDIETFYKHKKYSRYRKRLSCDSVGCESKPKTQKVEPGSPHIKDQAPSSVSSTNDAHVTVQDCESSCSPCDDHKAVSGIQGGKKYMESPAQSKDEPGEMSDSSGGSADVNSDSSSMDKISEKGNLRDTGMKFKWDRQTRSQSGKTAGQSVCLKS